MVGLVVVTVLPVPVLPVLESWGESVVSVLGAVVSSVKLVEPAAALWVLPALSVWVAETLIVPSRSVASSALVSATD
jgi:hypothetical protein